MVGLGSGAILDPILDIRDALWLHCCTVIFKAPVGDLEIESALIL